MQYDWIWWESRLSYHKQIALPVLVNPGSRYQRMSIVVAVLEDIYAPWLLVRRSAGDKPQKSTP